MAQGRGAQQRQRAMQAMKMKKMYEQQREQIIGTQFNIDSMSIIQENAEVTIMSVEAVREGQKNLKASYDRMGGIDGVDRLMDDIADFQDEANEINNMMATSFAVPEGFDEADFENEFAAMEEEAKMGTLAGIAPAGPSYSAPQAASAPPLPVAGGYASAPLPTAAAATAAPTVGGVRNR